MKDFTETRKKFLNEIWPKFDPTTGEHITTGDEIADFFESELSKFIEGKKKEIIQHDELQKKGDNDYTRGWNNFRDFVLSLFDNPIKKI